MARESTPPQKLPEPATVPPEPVPYEPEAKRGGKGNPTHVPMNLMKGMLNRAAMNMSVKRRSEMVRNDVFHFYFR